MSIFEAAMIICFGMSWPTSIAKSIKTRHVRGKSLLFMSLVCLGYICGIVHKVLYSFDWVIWLYALNAVMVSVDIALYLKYNKLDVQTTEATLPVD